MRERSMIGGYELVKRIGSGGMSNVYKAIDADGREVALKLLHPEVAADPASRDRLRREVSMLQRVHGEYVAQILDAETEEQEVFIVTQLIDGPTLDADVRDSGRYEGADLVELGRELAAALRSIHEVDVLHRDLKPSNVMMGADGPVLIDFGIAQLGDDLRMTRTGALSHTPGWADPRVIRGGSPDDIADWWALSAVLAYAATGVVPYKAETAPAVMHRVLTGEPNLPGLSAEVEAAFRRALDPDVSRRIAFDDLVSIIEGTVSLGDADLAVGLGADGDAAAAPLVTGTSVDAEGLPVTGASRYQDTIVEDVDDYWNHGEFDDGVAASAGGMGHSSADEADDATRPIDLTGLTTAPYGVDNTRMQTAPGPQYSPQVESYDPPGTSEMPAGFDPHEPIADNLQSAGPARTSVFDRLEIANPHDFDPHTRELVPVGEAKPQYAGYPGQQQMAPFGNHPGRLPNWFRPARKARMHVLATGAILAIFSLVWPAPVAVVFAAIVVLVSIIGRADRDLRDRRVANDGPYKGETTSTLLRLPLTIIGAIARSAVSLGLGAGVAWFAIIGLDAFELVRTELVTPIGLAAGIVVTWFIGTNRNGREGARILMEGIAPTPGYRLFWLAILLVMAMAAVVVVSQTGLILI